MSTEQPSGDRAPVRKRRFLRFLFTAAVRLICILLWAWCIGAIWYSEVGPAPMRLAAVIVFAVAFPIAWLMKKTRPRTRIAFAVLVVAIIIAWQFKHASNEGDWSPDMAILPWSEFDGDLVHVRNIRFCKYESRDDYTVEHVDRTYDLTKLNSAYYMVEPFAKSRISAHTMLTFGFEDGEYLAISIEVRREKGQKFGPIPGMYKQYELMYVVADERDVIKLRTNHRRSEVYLYPLRSHPERRRAVLEAMLTRANDLREDAAFYNTWLASCNTSIVRHVNAITPRRIPLSWKVFLPGYCDELVYDLGGIDTDLPMAEARPHFRIDERARAIGDAPDFSAKIRQYD